VDSPEEKIKHPYCEEPTGKQNFLFVESPQEIIKREGEVDSPEKNIKLSLESSEKNVKHLDCAEIRTLDKPVLFSLLDINKYF